MWFQSVGENMELCGPIGYTAQIKKSALDKFKKICYNKKKTHFFPIGAAAFIIVTPHMVHPIGRAGPHLWDMMESEIGLTFNRKNCIWVYRSGTRPFVVISGPVNPARIKVLMYQCIRTFELIVLILYLNLFAA